LQMGMQLDDEMLDELDDLDDLDDDFFF
jgi:hypothetical protein